MKKILLASVLVFASCFDSGTESSKNPSSAAISSSSELQSTNSSGVPSSSSVRGFFDPSKPWVVSSYPSWRSTTLPLDSVPWESITHIRYAFAVPQKDGQLNVNEDLLQEMALQAHSRQKEVILAIGGGAGSAAFAEIIKDDSLIQSFTNHVLKLVDQYQLDGVVMDWEHWPTENLPDSVLDHGLLRVLQSLYPELKQRSKHLGMDVYASEWFGIHTLKEDFDYVDYLNIMTLDDAGSWSDRPAQHSSYELFESAIQYWKKRVGPNWKGQMSVTLPYYGKVFDVDYQKGDEVQVISYKEAVSLNPMNAFRDTLLWDNMIILHASLEFMEKKMNLIKTQGLMGVVNWEQSMDTRDTTSQTFQAHKYLYLP